MIPETDCIVFSVSNLSAKVMLMVRLQLRKQISNTMKNYLGESNVTAMIVLAINRHALERLHKAHLVGQVMLVSPVLAAEKTRTKVVEERHLWSKKASVYGQCLQELGQYPDYSCRE